METKMKITKILGALLLSYILSSNVFAATVKGAAYPISGTYNNMETQVCSADSLTILPAGYSTSYINSVTQQLVFTPDTIVTGATPAAALTAWLASSTALKALPKPSTLMNATQDPTALAGVNLVETPIQWGVMNNQQTFATTSGPYTTPQVFGNSAYAAYFILTSYNYSVPANYNNVKTGYALYFIASGKTSWVKYSIYMSGNTTTKATSGSYMAPNTTHVTIPTGGMATTYNYDCVMNGIITQ